MEHDQEMWYSTLMAHPSESAAVDGVYGQHDNSAPSAPNDQMMGYMRYAM